MDGRPGPTRTPALGRTAGEGDAGGSALLSGALLTPACPGQGWHRPRPLHLCPYKPLLAPLSISIDG